jgi:deoxyhypusine synthase
MLEESLRLEKIVMPKDQYEELESQHMEAFEKARTSHKFCTINSMTAVLEEKQWLDFF